MLRAFACCTLLILNTFYASIRVEENRTLPEKGVIQIASETFEFNSHNMNEIEPFVARMAGKVGSQAVNITAVGDFSAGDMEKLLRSYFPQDRGTDLFQQLPLVEWEMKTIYKIIDTMADKNVFQLALEKRTLEKKGKKIRHVHPLRFIGYIFSDPHLAKCMREVRKSTFKWHSFVEGFSERMYEEAHRNNVTPYVPGFAAALRISEGKVYEYVHRKDWEGLVKYLL